MTVSDNEYENLLLEETEGLGRYLKTVRESKNISLQEISSSTRISKSRIIAIEEEDFIMFPAAVFVHSLVTQLAKRLDLPHEKIAKEYVNRYREANGKPH